jgi:hypothetical protein
MNLIAYWMIFIYTIFVSVGGAMIYFRSMAGKGVLPLFPILLASLGLLGVIARIISILGSGLVGMLALSIILGILVVMMGMTIMSIAPWVALTLVGLGLSLGLGFRIDPNNIPVSLLAMVSGGLVSFPILLRIVTTNGIEMIEAIHSTRVGEAFPQIDYEDTFRVLLPEDHKADIQSVGEAFAISLRPWWLKVPVRREADPVEFKPGSNFGGWEVFHKSASELIIGLDRNYIDLRISLLIKRDKDGVTVNATTVARYNNLLGRLYFIPVRFGHQIVLADTMRRLQIVLGNGQSI